MTKRRDLFALPINVIFRKCGRFRLPKSRESKKLNKVRAFLRVRAESLRADVGNDCFEFIKGWCLANRFWEFHCLQIAEPASRG